MELADYILNLVGILLWVSWRGMRTAVEDRTVPLSLAGTLRRAEARQRRGAFLLYLLVALLLGRAVVYRMLAPDSDWTPRLDLQCVVPAFPNEAFLSLLVYSALSFLRLLATALLWMFAVLVINGRSGNANRIQKGLRRQLALAGRMPWPLQLLLPLAATIALWIASAPLLAFLGVTSHVPPIEILARQGLIVAGSLYLSLKYFLPALLLIHLLLTYIYFGRNDLCDLINLTAKRLLAPLRWLPLQLGRVDFSPLAGAAIILLLLHVVPMHVLPLAERLWSVRLRPVWPQ